MILMEKNKKWAKFINELGRLSFFWLFVVVYFLIFRIFFITFFYKQISNSIEVSDYLKVLFMGFRFDSTVAAYFITIPFLSLLILSFMDKFNIIKKIRILFQYIFVFSSTVICMVTLNYFKEYNDQFNNFLFLALYDDQKAVMKTIIEDFNPILNISVLIIVSILCIYLFNKIENKSFAFVPLSKIQKKGYRIALVLLTLFLFVSSIRGSFSKVPAIRKWAGVSKDSFLNKTVINPFRSLKYAIEDFKEINIMDGDNPFMANDDFEKKYPNININEFLKKTAKGPSIEKPTQIFITVMESYDSWPLMEKYLPFGLSKNLSEIAVNGTHFTNFLPASGTTFDSFAAVTTGVPYCGVNVSKIGRVNNPTISSMFSQFKKLGYKINVYYGGFLSWQNIGDFCNYQGADQIFSGADMGGENDSGAWGVEDEKLFDLILKNTDTKIPSLNIILTSSYHPPYSVDVYSKGFMYKSKKDFPKEMLPYFDDGMTIEELGHLWYGDLAIGNFVKKAEQKFSNGIFCFTGDHFGRRFINHSPNLYERSSVPFVIYGKSIKKEVNKTPGTHVDIIPTLIEMIAPKGFEYYSFGSSIFNKTTKESISLTKIIEGDDLYHFPKEAKVEKINLNNFKETQIEASPFIKNHNDFMALAWYYTVKGNKKTTSSKKK